MKIDNFYLKTETPPITEFFGGFERCATTAVYGDAASGKSIFAMQAACDNVRINDENSLYVIIDPNITFVDLARFIDDYNKEHKTDILMWGVIYNPTEKDIQLYDPEIVYRWQETYPILPSGGRARKPRWKIVREERTKPEGKGVFVMKIADPVDALLMYGVPINIQKSEKGMLTARLAVTDKDDLIVESPLSSEMYKFINDYECSLVCFDSISAVAEVFEIGGRVNLLARHEVSQALLLRMNTVNSALNAAILAVHHAGGEEGVVKFRGGRSVKYASKNVIRILKKDKWTSRAAWESHRLFQRMRHNFMPDKSAAMWTKIGRTGFTKSPNGNPDFKPDGVKEWF